MITASRLVLQSAGKASGAYGSGIDHAGRLGEHDASDERRASGQVSAGESQLARRRVVREGSDLADRCLVCVATGQVVADGWLTANSDLKLWLRLSSAKPLERNRIVEQIIAVRQRSVRVDHKVVSSQSSDVAGCDGRLTGVLILASEAHVETSTVLSVWEFTCLPHLKPVVQLMAAAGNCLLDLDDGSVVVDLFGLSRTACRINAIHLELASERSARSLDSVWQSNSHCRSGGLLNLNACDRFVSDKLCKRDLVHR